MNKNIIDGFASVATLVFGRTIGEFTMLILVFLAAFVLIAWVGDGIVSHINSNRQESLLGRATFFLARMKECDISVQEIQRRLFASECSWRSSLCQVWYEVDLRLRTGLVCDSDGYPISIHLFRHELDYIVFGRINETDCSTSVAWRVIRQAGFHKLEDKSILTWIHEGVKGLIDIKIEEMTVDLDKESPAGGSAMLLSCVARLRGVVRTAPSVLVKTLAILETSIPNDRPGDDYLSGKTAMV